MNKQNHFTNICILISILFVFVFLLTTCGDPFEKLIVFNLTLKTNGNGTTEPTGEIKAAKDTPLAILAEPDSGYNFVSWEVVSGRGVRFGNQLSANTKVTLEKEDAVIKANFTTQQYTLTVTSGENGSVFPSGNVTVNHGEAIDILALPDDGYQFVNWTTGSTGVSFENLNLAETTVTLTTGNATIQANFAQTVYQITINNDGNGIAIPAGQNNIAHDVPLTITANPNEGYDFVNWTVENGSGVTFGDTNTAETIVTLINGNATIKANFKIKTYTLTIETNGYGTTYPTGDIEVNHREATDIEAIVTERFGYITMFENWTYVKGETYIGNVNSRSTTVTLSSGNATIRANFKQTMRPFPEVTITLGNRQVTLEWDSIPMAESYTLIYTNNGTNPSNTNGKQIIVSSPYTLTDIENEYLYKFIIKAHATGGSDMESELERVIPISQFTLAPRVKGEHKQLRIEWNDIKANKNGHLVDFTIYRSFEKNGIYNQIGTTNNTYYIDTNVDDTWYFYKLMPANSISILSEANGARIDPFCIYNPELVAKYTSSAYGVYVSGNYAYIADGAFRIINVSNPASPLLVSIYHTPCSARSVYVSGNYAYIADDGGLRIINVSNPASPTLASTYDTPDSPNGVYVNENYAYIADGSSGLQIINVSNPASPTLAATYNTPDSANGVYVSGNYAYIADGYSGLQIINVSNPASPTLAATYDTPDSANGVYISGNYAYIADGSSGLQIINVSNPASPTLEGTYNTSGSARGVYISGNYAYIADDSSGLQIINVSNPASPTLAATYDTPGYANGVYVSGNYAYIADKFDWLISYGLPIINVSNPASPTLAATYDTPGSANGVYVSGNYAYIADDQAGFQIINISNPTCPTNISVIDTSAWIDPWAFLTEVYVSGNYAFVADYDVGFWKINISNPTSPTFGISITNSGVSGVYVNGNYAYIATGLGLQIINVSNSTYEAIYTIISVSGVYVNGNYAYIAAYGSGLQIINVSNPASPTLEGTYNTPGSARGVYVRGNYAYIADGSSGLQIINVSNPASPSLESTYDTPGSACRVYVSGNYAYIADGSAGLQIINIFNPASPTLEGTYDTPGSANGVYVSGKYVYVADGTAGLQIINLLP